VTILTLCSEKHQEIRNRILLPSLKNLGSGFEVRNHSVEQLSTTGSYADRGWKAQMAIKIRLISEACRTQSQRFLYVDNDVVFLDLQVSDILALGDQDLWCQYSGRPDTPLCAGVMVIKPGRRQAEWWSDLAAHVVMGSPGPGDQHVLNHRVRTTGITAQVLDPRVWWSPGKLWEPGQSLVRPATAKLLHLNWCLGCHKLAMLEHLCLT
jgi:hypothetical protein